MNAKDLLKKIKEDNVKFVSLQFTDMVGAVKSVDMPLHNIEGAVEDGVWFDGSSVEGFARIQESDMRLILDLDTYAVLPWSPADRRRARIFCDIYMPDGAPFEGDPRGKLKRALEKLGERGWVYNIGPEPEFFLFKDNGAGAHPVPHDVGGYFDFSADDDAVRVRTELMEALMSMGIEVEVGHHEVALGQHEIDFRFANALKAADNVLTLKYTVKAIAAQHGLTASFMPKPVFGINGSGMHCHQSLFDDKGNNLFFDAKDEFHLSATAYSFIAGQLKHARALAGVVSPTVNSYKRLVPGYEAPVNLAYSQRNRSACCRIPMYSPSPKAKRIEYRCPDPSCNPYLAFSAIVMAAIDGIQNKISPGEPLDKDIYDLPPEEAAAVPKAPGSLDAALDALEADHEFLLRGDVFTDDVVKTWISYKRKNEVDAVRLRPHPYEFCLYYDI